MLSAKNGRLSSCVASPIVGVLMKFHLFKDVLLKKAKHV